jgi:hypothetical protein
VCKKLTATLADPWNHGGIIAILSTAVATKGALTDLGGTQEAPEEISAVPPADGITDAMPMVQGTASAVPPEADGSYEDEQGRVDDNHEAE